MRIVQARRCDNIVVGVGAGIERKYEGKRGMYELGGVRALWKEWGLD
jgi:hypothetical protein